MKKILLLVVSFCAFPALAETISAVTFNPTRLGDYTHLKVSKRADFKGGLKATEFNVYSPTGKQVQMKNTGTQVYDINQILASASGSSVHMPYTIFRGASTSSGSISYEDLDPKLPYLKIKGGNTTFHKESFINNMQTVSRNLEWMAYGKTVIIPGTLRIPGSGIKGKHCSYSIYEGMCPDNFYCCPTIPVLLSDNSSPTSIKGFRLGTREIRPFKTDTPLKPNNGTYNMKWLKKLVGIENNKYAYKYVLGVCKQGTTGCK